MAGVGPLACGCIAMILVVCISFLVHELKVTTRIDVFSGLINTIQSNFMLLIGVIGEFQILTNDKVIPAYPTLALIMVSSIGLVFMQFITTIVYQHTGLLSISRFGITGIYADSTFKLIILLQLGLNAVVGGIVGGLILANFIYFQALHVHWIPGIYLIASTLYNYYTFYYHFCEFV
jgi:hypothetical protein